MTDDELFALSTRIHRIESLIITFHSLYPDDPPSDTLLQLSSSFSYAPKVKVNSSKRSELELS